MAKPKAVPDASSRESPYFWFKMIDASGKRRQRVNEQAARFMRWDRGNLSDLIDPRNENSDLRWKSGLENNLSAATTASMADIFFRCPRFVVRTPYVPKRKPLPLPGQPPVPDTPSSMLFNPDFARCEEEMLRQQLDHANYFEKATRMLQDALLADMGVLKVTHDAETAIDDDTLFEAQQEADEEVRQFLSGNPKAMWAKEDQIHSVHIDRKGQLLAAAQRGEVQLDRTAIKYLTKHIKAHEAMKGSERPTETIRANRIRIARINPVTDYFYDPTVDDRSNASWRACRFLLRKADVLGNEDYDEDARKEVRNCTDRWQPRSFMPMLTTAGSFDIPEEMVMCFEVFDLIDQKRILFADGSTIPLLYEDRGELAWIQPSGPFHELVFKNDAMEGQGVPQPCAFEAEQAAATHIASANVAAAIQGQPKTMFDSRVITADQAKKLWDARAGEFIAVDPKGLPDKKLDESFAQVPPPAIPEQNLLVLQKCIMGIERRSGLGTSKMGGGEQASTATGAALGADASSSISEDRGAKLDAATRRHARDVVRLTRRYTPKSQWVQMCGDVAVTAVPDRISVSDACNDIGVEVIPGSSRRKNTNVDQKQLLDGVTAIAGLPMMQGPAGQKLILTIARQFFDDGGASGLPWDDVEQEVEQMALMQQMQAQMGGAPAGPPGTEPPDSGGPGDSRQDETAGVSQNDVEQGVTNAGAGGGRIATGASIGDRISQNRAAATQRVASRGA